MFQILAWLISSFYQFTRSYAVAIVLLTVTVRLLLFPLTAKQMRSMQRMQQVQPDVKELQKKYKDDRQKLNEELMKFYKENSINPAAGCLPLLLQLPIFLVLNLVIRGLNHTGNLGALLVRVPQPKYLGRSTQMYRDLVNSGGRMVSWGIDLAQSAASAGGTLTKRLPYLILIVLIGVTGYVQQAQASKRQPAPTGQAAQMQNIMKYLPILFAVFSYNFPAGLVLYWVASNLWTLGQQSVLYRIVPPLPNAIVDVESSAKSGTSKSAKGVGQGNGKVTPPKNTTVNGSTKGKGTGSDRSAEIPAGGTRPTAAARDRASRQGNRPGNGSTASGARPPVKPKTAPASQRQQQKKKGK